MKKNLWIIFAAALATSVLAQDASNTAPTTIQAPPPEPTPATNSMPAMPMVTPAVEAPTNAPAAPKKATTPKTSKKKTTTKKTAAAPKKKAPELKTVPLVAGSGGCFRQSRECPQQGGARG